MTALSRTPGAHALVVVGAGGLASEFIWVADELNRAGRSDAAPEWKIVGYADDAVQKRNKRIGDYLVHGTIAETAARFSGQDISFAIAVGNNYARMKLAGMAQAAGWHPVTLVHPSVIVARDAQIGAGTYVAPGCVICPGARVGNYVVINTHSSVGHDSVLEDYAQVCPGARISGGCRIEKYGFLGSNASLNPGVSVGEGAVVAANSYAVRTVPSGVTVIGCPAIALPGPRQRAAQKA